MHTLWAKSALLADGWRGAVRVDVANDGRIAAVAPDAPRAGSGFDILLPAPANLHSHGFQRAMAGLSERRGPDPRDTFWTWRQLMFRFLDRLTPEDVQAITAFAQMEMLQAGFGSVAEFHYLHHQPGGIAYDAPSELSQRIVAAAEQSGIGLTLLPVLYQVGGCDGRGLAPGQIRFGNDIDRYVDLLEGAARAIALLPADASLGVAPHSLRAVTPQGLRAAIAVAAGRRIHMHVAEQVAEVDEVLHHRGARPVEWLFDTCDPGANWCLIHATQMEPRETEALARSGAVAGLCPVTEANLGDGIFDAVRFLAAGGRFGIGTDSNIRISLAEELRALEYSQRLRDKARAVLATPDRSTGRRLWQDAAAGGAQALGRGAGTIAVGAWADLVALDGGATDLIGRDRDTALDSFAVTGSNAWISDVWSAGRHLVQDGRHRDRDAITAGYRATLLRLRDIL